MKNTIVSYFNIFNGIFYVLQFLEFEENKIVKMIKRSLIDYFSLNFLIVIKGLEKIASQQYCFQFKIQIAFRIIVGWRLSAFIFSIHYSCSNIRLDSCTFFWKMVPYYCGNRTDWCNILLLSILDIFRTYRRDHQHICHIEMRIGIHRNCLLLPNLFFKKNRKGSCEHCQCFRCFTYT